MFSHWEKTQKRVQSADGMINVEKQGPLGPHPMAYLIPSLKSNLISLGGLDDMGMTITISNGHMIGNLRGTEIFNVKKKVNTWSVDFEVMNQRILDNMPDSEKRDMWWLKEQKVAVLSESSKPTEIQKSLRLWHERLGHRSEASIVSDSNRGLLKIGYLRLVTKIEFYQEEETSRQAVAMRAENLRVHHYRSQLE
jgi:hypothetical protein